MNKCHTPITWHNDTTPAINETNLNYEDGCIDTIDDRVVAMDTSKANQSDLLKAFKDVSLNTTTGVITFTLFDNTTKTIDTLLEKVAINFDYDDNPSSAHYQNLIIELEDGTVKYIDMSALITEYEFTTTDTIAFTVDQDGAVSASVRDGSITGTKLQPNYLADVTAQANAASASASAANTDQLKSEGYANGTQGGVPVSSGSPYYENNAKYWKEQAQAIASSSLSGLSDVSITNPQDGDLLTYDASNSEWVNSTGAKAARTDLTSIIATGATNTTGAQIPNGAYFYLNGVFCRAIANIASNASFTKNTNYKETTVDEALNNSWKPGATSYVDISSYTSRYSPFIAPQDGYIWARAQTSGYTQISLYDDEPLGGYAHVIAGYDSRFVNFATSFVRKGTKMFIQSMGGLGSGAYYLPMVRQ